MKGGTRIFSGRLKYLSFKTLIEECIPNNLIELWSLVVDLIQLLTLIVFFLSSTSWSVPVHCHLEKTRMYKNIKYFLYYNLILLILNTIFYTECHHHISDREPNSVSSHCLLTQKLRINILFKQTTFIRSFYIKKIKVIQSLCSSLSVWSLFFVTCFMS